MFYNVQCTTYIHRVKSAPFSLSLLLLFDCSLQWSFLSLCVCLNHLRCQLWLGVRLTLKIMGVRLFFPTTKSTLTHRWKKCVTLKQFIKPRKSLHCVMDILTVGQTVINPKNIQQQCKLNKPQLINLKEENMDLDDDVVKMKFDWTETKN